MRAFAQDEGAVPTSFQVEQFRSPPVQRTALLGVEASDVLPHLTPSAGIVAHMSDNPLQVVARTGDEERVTPLIARRYTVDLGMGIGLYDRFQVGFALPVVAQSGESLVDTPDRRESLSGASFGDMRVVPKWRIWQLEGAGRFGFAATLPTHLPVGDTDSYNSSGAIRVEPRLVVDWQPSVGSPVAGTRVAANVGYELGPERAAVGRLGDNVVTWGLGAEWPVGGGLSAVGNVLGEWGGVEGAGIVDKRTEHAIEVIGAMQAEIGRGLSVRVGGGSGLTAAVGMPSLRLLASVEYVGTSRTGAGDTADARGAGCDGSGGCRGPDKDGDGVPDARDVCPDSSEDLDGFRDEDGCADPDNDGDGIDDADDRCPNRPGVAENGGCPLVDSDGDGIVDRGDEAPYAPEDFDGYHDADGLPDPDNDGDGIADVRDACPGRAENINGVEDEDGCPDQGKQQVAVTDGKIEFDDRIYFDSDRATIRQRSFSILEQVAAVLEAESDIERIRIEGHTDGRGQDVYNLALSQRRANAVREFLIDRGVDPERLESRGYGESEPIASNDTEEGRRKNRRVEFRILSEREEDE
jgi:outer membrane protein OmpA-like peptidoglycan-associated protein